MRVSFHTAVPGEKTEINTIRANNHKDRFIVMFQKRDSKKDSLFISRKLVPVLDSRARVQGNAGRLIIIKHRLRGIDRSGPQVKSDT